MYIAVPESPELMGAWGRLRAAARGEAKRIPARAPYPYPPEDIVRPEHGLALPR